MKWFRHLTATEYDNILGVIKDDLGPEGYGRFWALAEAIGHQMKTDKDAPSATYSAKKWANFLMCPNEEELNKFLQYLESKSVIKREHTQNGIRLDLPKLSELVDRRSISSDLREPSGGPRIEIDKNRLENTRTEKTIKEETRFDQFGPIPVITDADNKKEDRPKPSFGKRNPALYSNGNGNSDPKF